MIMNAVQWIFDHLFELIILYILSRFMLKGFEMGGHKAWVYMGYFIAAIALAAFFAPKTVRIINDYTGMERFVETYALNNIGFHELPTNSQGYGTEEQTAMINDLNTTNQIKRVLIARNTESVHAQFGAGNFQDYVGLYISNIIINIVTFIVWMLFFGWGILKLSKKYEWMKPVPFKEGVGQLVGAVTFGFVGIMFVWVVFLMILALSGTVIGGWPLGFIQKSVFLDLLYNNNFIDYLANYSLYRLY